MAARAELRHAVIEKMKTPIRWDGGLGGHAVPLLNFPDVVAASKPDRLHAVVDFLLLVWGHAAT